MNKTLSIGLAGFSFVIEEHAYIKLSDYLSALRSSLDASEAEEVMHDIEIRMVEIFKDSLGKREVINVTDVEKVISQIGEPEKIEQQEEAYFSKETSNSSSNSSKKSTTFSSKEQKQLFRDPENAKLGGVCSGLANYFGMDVTWMRVVWVIIAVIGMFTAVSTMLLILIYIILWIVLPKAETAADFLKMKGKPMNFDNLKQESTKIVQFANESTQKVGEMYNESKPFINQTGSGLWNLVRYILGGISGLIGVGALIGSIFILGASWVDSANINFLPGKILFYLQESNLQYVLIVFAFLSVFIPALLFLYIAVKLFSPKSKFYNTGYVFGALMIIWLGLLVFIGIFAMKYKTQYSGTNDETDNVAINTKSDSIIIDLKKVAIPQNFKSYGDVFSDNKTIYQEQYPNLDVTRKEGDFTPYLVIKKAADGYNKPLKLQIPVEVQGNKLLIPNYINYPYEYKMRNYRTDYELVVPSNKKVLALNGENGFSINDDEKDKEEEDKTTITIDSTAVNSSSNSTTPPVIKDSVIVNGKKVSEEEANRMLQEANKKSYKNVSISIVNGKKEITIKTN